MSSALAGPGDYDPRMDQEEAEEARWEALRSQADDIAKDATERGKWEPVEALLGMAWLWERMQDGEPVDVDSLTDALVDALYTDILGSNRAPLWFRREREIRRMVSSTVEPSDADLEAHRKTYNFTRDGLSDYQLRLAMHHGRLLHMRDEIGRILEVRA